MAEVTLPGRVLAACALLAAAAAGVSACDPFRCAPPVVSIGRPGTGDGEFRDPRGIAVSEHGVAVVDKTGRLQFFDLEGRWLRTHVIVPGDVRRGLPTGVTWLPGGGIAVADTHQSRVVLRAPDGTETDRFGEYGVGPGQFLLPQRLTRRADGSFLVCDYGFEGAHRVQQVRADGSSVRAFGGGAPELGGLGRPMAAVPLDDGRTLVADAKAGLVVFDAQGTFAGRFGPALPEGAVIYGACRADGPEGDVYAVDLARSLLLRYAADGTFVGAYGGPGDAPAGLRQPWDVAWFAGRVYVADRENHRVARIDPEGVKWTRD